ncbi:MAG: hypothetical protein ACOCP8_08715 [archaeon]
MNSKVVWTKGEDEGKIIGECPICENKVKVEKILKRGIVAECEKCTFTLEKDSAKTKV